MNSHRHAALTRIGRAQLVSRVLEQGWKLAQAAQPGVSERTGYKWLARFKAEGASGLQDRSSRPKTCPHASDRDSEERTRFEQLRRQRLPLWRIALQRSAAA